MASETTDSWSHRKWIGDVSIYTINIVICKGVFHDLTIIGDTSRTLEVTQIHGTGSVEDKSFIETLKTILG